ncbi:nuclear transport factor 2 family protein [Sphingobacterium oryzagri]|uniref:Nuclear transport factor 2 family protein n=1 Tax=Sphingobacterium oryzagri TaxID=3025669 RepID=A0ABY7WJK6_9SPHI|nr:nuclear transport factor 2 family protein [Sphingobacterium sp. KACC 22765]WDF68651.1 nuclear transport factor 2 family protein [Sphingobacterium sp. KACC 22765]WDF68663.1 nuclear transport factor 2 family protein [Sphingobacterium sp. KACC 22765]
MKKTLTTIAAAIIMISSFSSFAAEKTNPLKNVESAKIINTYLEATTLGSIELNKFLFADDFQYSNSANNDTFNKREYSNFLKAHKGVNFDCKTSYEILDQSGKACMAKATMVFENFTRVDYITLSQDQDGWKVSKVVTTYP